MFRQSAVPLALLATAGLLVAGCGGPASSASRDTLSMSLNTDPATFDPKSLVLSPLELLEADANWLVKWAQGLVSAVPVKGGGAIQMSDLERFRLKAGRRKRTQSDGAKLRAAS